MVWYGMVWYGMVWYGMVCTIRYDMVWCVVWYDMVWCKVCGVVWCGKLRYEKVSQDKLWYLWYDIV